MRTPVLLLFPLIACGDSAPPPTPVPVEAPAPVVDALALYEACGEAVEGPSEAGECSSDADCARTGCSSEVCVSKAVADAGLMGACIERPCHAVLDVCGCVEGRCSWSLK